MRMGASVLRDENGDGVLRDRNEAGSFKAYMVTNLSC